MMMRQILMYVLVLDVNRFLCKDCEVKTYVLNPLVSAIPLLDTDICG